MTDSKKVFIRKIRDEFQGTQWIKDSLNNSIQALSQNLYSKETHFIFELIQNAEDNLYSENSPSLSFHLTKNDPTETKNSDGALIITNNEIGFSEDNIKALCQVGKSTKTKRKGFIGEKGIGFKSVFKITSTPYIFSNGYNFSLPEKDYETGLGYIVPKWVENLPDKLNNKFTTIILPLDKEKFNFEDIRKIISEIEPECILFLTKIKEIKISIDLEEEIIIKKDETNFPEIQILIEKIKEEKDDIDKQRKNIKFLLFSESFDKPEKINQEKREEINESEVLIAVPTNIEYSGKGKIFAYLPVRSDSGFPFIMNADFILTSSREELSPNCPWNDWLLECLAKLTAKSLLDLKDKGYLTIDFLNLLAKKLIDLKKGSKYSNFYCFAESICETLKNDYLFPASDDTHIQIKNAKLPRGKELVELFSHEQLATLYEKDRLFWLNPSITESGNYNYLHTYIVGKKYSWSNIYWEVDPLYEKLEVTAESISPKLSSNFFQNQPIEWIIQFIQYLNKPKSSSEFKKTPFIRLSTGVQVKLPLNERMPRTAWFAPINDSGLDLKVFPIVHSEISKIENIRKFLEKEGIREIDTMAIVEKSILPKYQEANHFFNITNYQTDLDQIRIAYINANDNEKIQLATDLNRYQWIATVHASGREPNQIVWKKPDSSDLFEKSEDNESWFKELEDVDAFFLHPVVIESLNDAVNNLVKHKSLLTNNLSTNEHNVCLLWEHSNHKIGLNGFNPNATVVGFKSAWTNWNEDRAMILWRILLSAPNKIICGETQFSTNRSILDKAQKIIEYTDVGVFCCKESWLFDKSGNRKKPSDLMLSELSKDFESTSMAAKELSLILGMKQPEKEEALDLIAEGDLNKKLRIERFLSASADDQEKMLKSIPQEIPTMPAISFKEGLKNLNRPQRGLKGIESRVNILYNPDRYLVKLGEEKIEEINDFTNSSHKISFTPVRDIPSNSVSRLFLYKEYKGHCQVTGTTFQKANPDSNGEIQNYFEACSLVSYSNADYLNDAGNMLCVSADTMAKFKNASIQFIDSIEEIIEIFKKDGSSADTVKIKIFLAGEECAISWSLRHFMRLIALYENT